MGSHTTISHPRYYTPENNCCIKVSLLGSYYRRAFKMKFALPILILVVMVCSHSNANPTEEVQLSSASEVRMALGQEQLIEDRRGRCGVRCRRQKTKKRCKTRCKQVYITGKYRERCYGRCNAAFG